MATGNRCVFTKTYTTKVLICLSLSNIITLYVQLSPLLECDPTVCLPEKSKVTRGLARGWPNISRGGEIVESHSNKGDNLYIISNTCGFATDAKWLNICSLVTDSKGLNTCCFVTDSKWLNTCRFMTDTKWPITRSFVTDTKWLNACSILPTATNLSLDAMFVVSWIKGSNYNWKHMRLTWEFPWDFLASGGPYLLWNLTISGWPNEWINITWQCFIKSDILGVNHPALVIIYLTLHV
jgi:hypothetical protein